MGRTVIEIGDGGVHLLVARITGARGLEPLTDEWRPLRITAAVERDGGSHGIADLLVETVRRLARRARDIDGEPPRCLVTGVLATTDGDLIAQLVDAAGSPPHLVTGEDHARLSFLGATAGIRDHSAPVVLIDLGAQHLRLMLGRDGEVSWAREVDLGADALIGALGIADAVDEPTAERLGSLIRERLRAAAAPLHHRSRAWRCVASGQLVRHLAAAIARARGGGPPPAARPTVLSFPEFLDARTRFEPDGSLLGTVAAAVIAEVADAIGVDDVTYSGWGVREAAVLEEAGARPTRGREARRRAVRSLAKAVASDRPHADHVARLAVRLFDVTAPLHDMDVHDRELLEHAARLHDVGASISPAARHRLGAAFLQGAVLPGFSDEDLAVLTCLVRFHKGPAPSIGDRPFAELSPPRRRDIDRLASLLRVADGLDRGHDLAVKHIVSHVGERLVRLVIDGYGDLEMARWGAAAAAPSFLRTFGRELDVIPRRSHPVVLEGLRVPHDLRT